MSTAHNFSVMAQTHSQMLSQVVPSSVLVPLIFGRVYKALHNHRCDWYDNFTRVVVSVKMNSSPLPEGFWTYTNEYGEVLGKTEYMMFSQFFEECGFKLLSCGHRPIDVPGVPMGTHVIYFNLEVLGESSTTPQPETE